MIYYSDRANITSREYEVLLIETSPIRSLKDTKTKVVSLLAGIFDIDLRRLFSPSCSMKGQIRLG